MTFFVVVKCFIVYANSMWPTPQCAEASLHLPTLEVCAQYVPSGEPDAIYFCAQRDVQERE